MFMVRFFVRDFTEGCSATQVYFPSFIALTFFSESVEEGRIQSSPCKKNKEKSA